MESTVELINPDTIDLEAIFNAAQSEQGMQSRHGAGEPKKADASRKKADTTDAVKDAYDVFHRIGHITRKLHDALQELGYDKQIESAVSALPDARTRLDYIARLTGDAANKVLNTVDSALQIQESVDYAAHALGEKVKVGYVSTSEVAAFLEALEEKSVVQRGNLTEIMMAQDFHDLTGQVIRKVVDLAATLEEQLVKLLLETTPVEQRNKVESAWLNGPVVETKGRTDVVTNQAQVDDLLESLGF
jgi:chemotaxis protein CheZ